MAEEKKRVCGSCGHCCDYRGDAMVYCRILKMYVVRNSIACVDWTDTTYF